MSEDKIARVNGTFVNASFKYAVEICKWLRGRTPEKAVNLLRLVEEKKVGVPMTRYKKKISHKPGIGPARYPVKTSNIIRELLESAVKNAESQGMKKEKLIVRKLEANRAVSARRAARFRRGKLTNIMIEVHEQ